MANMRKALGSGPAGLVDGDGHTAGLWLTMEEALRNSQSRRNFHSVMGDYADHRAANAYERQLDKDDRRA